MAMVFATSENGACDIMLSEAGARTGGLAAECDDRSEFGQAFAFV